MRQASDTLASSVRPLGVFLPRADVAAALVAPQYTDPSLEESSDAALGGPLGFLNLIRSEVDAPRRDPVARQALLRASARQLRELLDGDSFDFHAPPVFVICRLEQDGHSQTGIIADVALEAYQRGLVKVHESTRQDQEDRLLEYMNAVRASFLPVFLIHRPSSAVGAAIALGIATSPTIDVETGEGLRMKLWVLRDPALIADIAGALAGLESLYVADGHHRAAAAARFAQSSAAANVEHSGAEPYAHIVSVLFSSDQLAIHPYDRCITLNGRRSEDVLSAIGAAFELERLGGPAAPPPRGELLMRLAEEWFAVRIPERLRSQSGVAGLDVSILHEHLLEPVLGVGDARTDPRLEFVPGTHGPGELERLCRGPSAVSFALHATSVEELMDVSDRGEIMPPKSTYFAPKLRSGLIVRLL